MTTSPEVPEVTGPPDATGAAARFRLESELRRLERELALEQDALRALSGRLREAEREAATAGGAVVDAMAAELTAWQDRARQAEAELAAIRGSALYRVAAPAMALYRVRRRLPGLARAVLRRLG